jgi:hypothetical protein
MARKKLRGKVSVPMKFIAGGDPVFLSDGFTVPRQFPVHVDFPDDVQMDLDVEVADGRARARRVTVSHPGGIGWATLAKLPVRDIVGTAVLMVLQRATVQDHGDIRLEFLLGDEGDEQAWRVMQQLVGYSPKTDDFERVSS